MLLLRLILKLLSTFFFLWKILILYIYELTNFVIIHILCLISFNTFNRYWILILLIINNRYNFKPIVKISCLEVELIRTGRWYGLQVIDYRSQIMTIFPLYLSFFLFSSFELRMTMKVMTNTFKVIFTVELDCKIIKILMVDERESSTQQEKKKKKKKSEWKIPTIF